MLSQKAYTVKGFDNLLPEYDQGTQISVSTNSAGKNQYCYSSASQCIENSSEGQRKSPTAYYGSIYYSSTMCPFEILIPKQAPKRRTGHRPEIRMFQSPLLFNCILTKDLRQHNETRKKVQELEKE